MKTKLISLIAIATTFCVFFTSCKKKDSSPSFDYPMEMVYGTWQGTEIYLASENKWVDITKDPYTKFAFSIKFNTDNTYYGAGYFGTGNGTYKAIGKSIITYVDNAEYARYDVVSLSSNAAELNMSMGTSSIKIRVKKQ